MSEARAEHERISFSGVPDVPAMDLLFTACRIAPEGYVFDILDFDARTIDRWSVPFIRIPGAIRELEAHIPAGSVPFGYSHREYHDECIMGLHSAQLSPDGRLFIGMGDFYNGLFSYLIDTASGEARGLASGFDRDLMLYSSTGDLTPGGEHWLFARWPLRDSLDIINANSTRVRCEIGRARASEPEVEVLYRLKNADRVHQVTCSPDGRHVVFVPFRWDMNVPYPPASMDEDPGGYRRSHEGGMKLEELVTVDLESGRHWRVEIPVPVPAHSEFDPLEPSVFYLSAHNFHPVKGGVVLEGPATLFRMRIRDGETLVEGSYCDDEFFRISQHVPFLYRGRALVAVTNLPNKLDLIDCRSMSLWRRVELLPAPPLDFTGTGNLLCPDYPGSCYSLNPSRDGKYIVLEDSQGFLIYSVEEDRVLPARVPRYLPEGARAVGHNRLAGE